MGRYIVATTKSWNVENVDKLKCEFPEDDFFLVTEKEKLTKNIFDEINPEYVFFPHWSWIIPTEIFKNFRCVVFHMTDLPFGRGGSPLQNLIVRGIYETKISAIAVDEGIDTGAIYFKEPIDISEGNADEILARVSEVIFKKMIPKFIGKNPNPVEQEGAVEVFKRRKPSDSEIPDGLSQRQLYDFIRMLDGEGYPTAYRDIGGLRIFFRNAKLQNETLYTETTIIRR